ncbi:MAG: hypothetical protein HY399_02980 [Elusimicrobia bacterium]|nr:hypothetical protein [Elusimicrobiota bacterium]
MSYEIRRNLKLLLFFLLTPNLQPLTPICYGQEIRPLQEKAQYEKVLEDKVEEVLTSLLGPHQAKVMIDATIDFSRIEKINAQGKNSGGTSAGPDLSNLPGFSFAEAPRIDNQNLNQKYEKMLSYPTQFLKRMVVTVVINRSVSAEEVQRVRSVVSDLLKINPDQGDVLTVLQAPFPPVWKTIFQDPDLTKILFKYSLLSMMTFLALVVVAVCFLRIAGALSTMAKAQVHQVSMEMPNIESPRLGAPGYRELTGPGTLELPGSAREISGGEQESGERTEDAVVFGVRKDQVELLAQMLKKEEAGNVALVAAHLKPEVQHVFLDSLSSELRTQVLLKLGEVRFVEPDMILSLKDEIERRLQGAVGGIRMILEVMERAGPLEKQKILRELENRDPQMAQSVRAKILLPEDLIRLDEKEFSIFVSSVSSEDWAVALWELPQEFGDRVKSQLTEGAWKIIEQRMAIGRPPEVRIEKAQQKMMEVASSLMEAGKIHPPVASSLA